MGKAVGDEMMTRFVVPFEVAGLLLTAAVVGAIALAHREGDDEEPRLGSRATIMPATAEGTGIRPGLSSPDGTRASRRSPPS